MPHEWSMLRLAIAVVLGCFGAVSCFGALGCAGLIGPDPRDARIAHAEYELAADAFHRHRYRVALGHITHSIDLDADNPRANYLRAMTLLAFCVIDEGSPDCRYADAEHWTRRSLELDPELRDARNVLGVILVHRGKPREAVAVLRPLADDILYRSPEKAWGNLGWAHLEAGQTDLAIAALKRAVAAQPRFCVGHYRLGLAYEKKGEHVAARHALNRALTVAEGRCARMQDAFWARSRVFRALGETAALQEDLLRCHELGERTRVGRRCGRALQDLR
jgi:Tfp pilus assembly protein PilF